MIESFVERAIISPLRGRAQPGEIARRRLRQIDHHPSGRLDKRRPSAWSIEIDGLSTRLPMGTIVIGRSTDADLVVPDGTVSRLHAELQVTDSSISIRDLDSRFGTQVNDMTVELVELQANDRVRIGQVNAVIKHCAE